MKPLKTILVLAAMLLFSNVMPAQTNPYAGYQKTTSGLYYKFIKQGKGAQPQFDELVDANISCKVNDTTVIIPESDNTLMMTASQFPGDLYEGLAMMHVGDSASFIVNIDSVFVKMFDQPALPPDFKSTDIMRFEVRLDDCYPESEYVQRFAVKVRKNFENNYPTETENAVRQLEEYLADNNIKATPTASGLYYVKTQEGNGEKPVAGQMVTAHYTGKLLDGTVFDSSVERGQPFSVLIGVGKVIPGWDEGILLMSKGEKGVLYIPYYLAYGDREVGDMIAPFSNLIFEVELIDFE